MPLFDRITNAAKALLGSVTVRVDDAPGWQSLNQSIADRPRSEVYEDLLDGLEAWRKSFLIRRIVGLTRSYTTGGGIQITSKDPQVQQFITEFWNHPQNKLERKLGNISNHLVIDGELFPILFTNPVTGISYVRWRTARQISEVLTKENDYETETGYREMDGTLEGKLWHAPASPAAANITTPVMLHFAVNRPLDCIRGESDLTPILPWAKRYQEWLADRVRFNRQRTKQGMLDITVADDTQVEAVRMRIQKTNPLESGANVHGKGEEVNLLALNIDANDAAEDGKQLRQAVATGSMTALHYMGEGADVNYATAKEMGEPTSRFFTERQQEIIWALFDLIEVAYTRYAQVQGLTPPDDLQLGFKAPEVARADNAGLASAAHSITQAFAVAATHGWIDDETAITLILKFAGENITAKEIAAMLAKAKENMVTEPPAAPALDDTTDKDDNA